MTQALTFAAVGLFALLATGTASAQTAPAVDPHAGHTMSAQAPAAVPHIPPTADPHAGHDMSAMPGMSVAVPTGTALKASTPAAGAMLKTSPTEISLTLPHAMKVDSVVLTNAAGQRIPLSATLSDAEVETLTTPVPTLAAGTYTVAWTASNGADRTMTGTFGFMVH